MEAASPIESTSALTCATLEAQIREMYGRVAYTHKAHEKMADGYVARYTTIKTIEIALAALASGSLLIAVFGDSRAATVTGAALSTILLAFTLYFKEATLGERAQKHTAVAAHLWGLRERILSLLVDMRGHHDSISAQTERNEINRELEELYASAPRTSARAYRAAQRALKDDEELYFSDEELNRLLPPKLRIRGGTEGS